MKFDFLIRDGFVVDGTGGTWYRADIGVKEGKITDVCKNLPTSGADRIIDAKGLVVCPGFFDMHCHSELEFFLYPRCEGKIMQGVTTEFNGNCGTSPSGPLKGITLEDVRSRAQRKLFQARELGRVSHVDLTVEVNWTTLAEYMNCLDSFGGVSVNSAYMVGFGNVRLGVLGWENRSPTRDELDEMKALTAKTMEDGAFGFATGLQYPPQNFAETDEVIEIAKVVARYGGIHQSHIRRMGFVSGPRGSRAFLYPLKDTMLEAVKECIEIGERAGIPTVWSHAKIMGGWKDKLLAEELLREVNNARRRGVDITMDNWADHAKEGPANQILPLWAFEGGPDKMRERLKNPETRFKIRSIVKERLDGVRPQIDFRNAIIFRVQVEKNKDLIGKTLAEAAEMRGKEMVDLYLDMTMNGERPWLKGRTQSDEDVIKMLKHPAVLFGTDWTQGDLLTGPAAIGSKGGYKMYAMVLRKFVREMRVITLEEAVRKMTSGAANRLGLMDRGLIRPRMWADITIFDPVNIRERDGKYAEGVFYVLVNGVITVDNGEHTGARAGKILKHKYYPQ